VKKRFYVFLFLSRFYVFNVFNFCQRFLFKKRSLKIPSRTYSSSTLETTETELIGLDFVMKVAGCRAAL